MKHKEIWTPQKAKMQAKMELTKHMPVQFGKVKAQIFGGPFYEYVPGQRRLVGVKMAAEIQHPHDISIPTEDFETPTFPAMHAGIRKALQAILDGNDIYVGCMGGIGRTGLFMACMAKIMFDYNEASPDHTSDPVAYVRSTYYAKAVETSAQRKFVDDFDTEPHVRWLIEELTGIKRVEVPVEVPVEKVVYVFNPFLAFMSLFGPRK